MEIHREHRPEGAPVSGSSPSSQLLRLHEVLLWAACLCHANGGKQVVSPGLWGARGEGRPADGEQPQRRTLEPRAPPAETHTEAPSAHLARRAGGQPGPSLGHGGVRRRRGCEQDRSAQKAARQPTPEGPEPVQLQAQLPNPLRQPCRPGESEREHSSVVPGPRLLVCDGAVGQGPCQASTVGPRHSVLPPAPGTGPSRGRARGGGV